MRNIAFHRFLIKRISPLSAASYVAYLKRVERELRTDLDSCDLSAIGLSNIRHQLRRVHNLPERSVANGMSALASYVTFLRMIGGGIAAADTAERPVPPQARATSAEASGRHTFLRDASVRQLLLIHGQLMDELRERRVARTGNGPIGDYAEWLFARAFGWRLEANSSAGHDATDTLGTRYQIKGRRLSAGNPSRQLGILRRLPEKNFDILAAALFNPDCGVQKAILLPHATVMRKASSIKHTNGWRFMLEDKLWNEPTARDVTRELRRVE